MSAIPVPPVSRFCIHAVVVVALALTATGVVMLASTAAYASDGIGEDFNGLRRQVMFGVLGLGVMCLAAFADYRLFERYFFWFFIPVMITLVFCYVPGVGMEINGARRWISARAIGAGALRFQPSELGKIATVGLLAWWYARPQVRAGTFLNGFLWPLCLLVVPVLLVGFEKDLGTAALMGLTGVLVMFVAGARWRYLAIPAVAGVSALCLAVAMIPQRMERIVAFLNLEAHRQEAGLQQWRAMLAFGSGGVEGRGYGNGIEKLFYTPYAHTDFIFPMIGEEFGMIGTFFVVGAFIALVMCALIVSLRAPDIFGRLLGVGITVTIAIQALINMGVTTALLPNKGIPLPFISYGGSSLVVLLGSIGILINIHRQGAGSQTIRRDGFLLGPQITPRL